MRSLPSVPTWGVHQIGSPVRSALNVPATAAIFSGMGPMSPVRHPSPCIAPPLLRTSPETSLWIRASGKTSLGSVTVHRFSYRYRRQAEVLRRVCGTMGVTEGRSSVGVGEKLHTYATSLRKSHMAERLVPH